MVEENDIQSKHNQTHLNFEMDLHKVEVPISINGLNTLPIIKGLKMLLSSDDELSWDHSSHGSSFEYWGFIWKAL